MAKIRGIKPDTWTDEKIVSISPLARLLFIGMWNFACDNGHLDDSPLQLKMRILPVDNCDVSELLNEIIGKGLAVRKNGFLKVPNLAEHQKPDKRFITFCDHCEHDEDLAYPLKDSPSTRGVHDENTTSARGVHIDEGDGDGDGEFDGEVTRERVLPPKFCEQHPTGTDRPCRGCAAARERYEQADAERRKKSAAWAAWARGQPDCPHGTPGGNLIRPTVGTARCAQCRAERTAA